VRRDASGCRPATTAPSWATHASGVAVWFASAVTRTVNAVEGITDRSVAGDTRCSAGPFPLSTAYPKVLLIHTSLTVLTSCGTPCAVRSSYTNEPSDVKLLR